MTPSELLRAARDLENARWWLRHAELDLDEGPLLESYRRDVAELEQAIAAADAEEAGGC